MQHFVKAGFLFIFLGWPFVFAQNSTLDLTELSLEDLMSVEVTLPSKKAEKLSKSTAAIFVLAHEDIKRSSATNLPDVLRLIPGIQVSQLDGNKWAVSSRGDNTVLSNKLLVLVDGRIVYTPMIAGVVWDSQDLLLENIDRIEVIRGPGGSLWGANAVNGVINIITKHTRNTQGTSITLGSGTYDKQYLSVSQGGQFDKHSYYQLYAKTHYRNAFELEDGQKASDQWHMNRFGFRTDLESFKNTQLTFQGEMYQGQARHNLGGANLFTSVYQQPDENVKITGGHMFASMNHQISRDSELSAQLSYSRMDRIDKGLLGGKFDQIDFDIHHQKAINWKHSLMWGGTYRWTQDRIDSTALGYFLPASMTYRVIGAFFQDHIQINQDILRVTIGSKFEYNDFSGLEIQPNFRGLYTPNSNMTTWFAISKAVRTPSRGDQGFRVLYQQSDTLQISMRGTTETVAEQLTAFEIGQRYHPRKSFSIDISAYYNIYNNLRSIEPRISEAHYSMSSPEIFILPFETDNKLKARTMGLEFVVDSYIKPNLRIRSSYSFLNVDIDLSESNNIAGDISEKENAQNKAYIWSSWNPKDQFTIDLIFRYMDSLPSKGISSYLTCDIHLGWRATKQIRLTITGRNLLDKSHIEHKEDFFSVVESSIQRSVFGSIECHF